MTGVRKSRSPKTDTLDAFALTEKLRIGSLETTVYVPGPRTGSRAYIDLRHDAVALGRSVRRNPRRTWTRRAPRAPVVPQQVGAAAEVLGERLAVVLGQHAGRAPLNELVQVGGVAIDGERGRAQVRAAVGHQP